MSEKVYFNTKTHGLAYLNEVSEKQSQGSTSCMVKVSALMGAEGNVGYESMRLWVRGEAAQAVINQLKPSLDGSNKVTLAFVAADCKAKAFIVQKGANAGNPVAYQEGALVFVKSARVNGEEVYRAPEREGQ